MEVHQILPNMADGDAISNHAIELKRLLKSWGYQSEMYALFREGAVSQHCRPIREFKPKSDTVILYHYSIGCKQVSDLFMRCQGRKILIYHNITPHTFFLKYHAVLYEILKEGRDFLGQFKDQVELAIGDSQFNVEELHELGYQKAVALPIILDFEKFKTTPVDQKLVKYLGTGWTNFLFTGRIVPNKAQHDVIRCFAWYYKNVNPLSRLFLVGSSPYGAYVKELYRLAESLGIRNQVSIPGRVKFAELVTYYRMADVFLCMSDHEGFCVPLLEAMHFDIPIIAYSATGVPYTMGNAGILLKEKNPIAASEMAHLLVQDESFRNRVVATQRRRLADFQPDVVRSQYQSLIQGL
jgi:glycosyltransferase involved in cell wall biosynthesis